MPLHPDASPGFLLWRATLRWQRAISQALVARYALCAETITDVLEAKKALLRRSEMLEFVEVSDSLASVGGLDNLKKWVAKVGARPGVTKGMAVPA